MSTSALSSIACVSVWGLVIDSDSELAAALAVAVVGTEAAPGSELEPEAAFFLAKIVAFASARLARAVPSVQKKNTKNLHYF